LWAIIRAFERVSSELMRKSQLVQARSELVLQNLGAMRYETQDGTEEITELRRALEETRWELTQGVKALATSEVQGLRTQLAALAEEKATGPCYMGKGGRGVGATSCRMRNCEGRGWND
jgi:hypothetical protein